MPVHIHWRHSFLSGKTGTNILRKVLVPIISNDECLSWHHHKGIDVKLHYEMFCAGHSQGKMDACLVSPSDCCFTFHLITLNLLSAKKVLQTRKLILWENMQWTSFAPVGGLWRTIGGGEGWTVGVSRHHLSRLWLCCGPPAWHLPQGVCHCGLGNG